MTALFLCFRLVLLTCTLWGYGLTLSNKYKVAGMFIPVLLFSGIGSIMYIAGILNCMPLALCIILLCGWICLFKERKKIVSSFRFTVWGAVGALTCVYAFTFLKNAVYPDGDTLTHWAVVAREIFENNRLPNFTTEVVSYTSYPTGTAGFIYFFTKVLQYGEGQTLLAQALLLGSGLLPLFAFCRKGKGVVPVLQNGLVVLALLLSLHFNVRLDSLQVDNVLSLLSVGGVCIALYYLENPRKGIALTLPILCFLSITKNSGPFFCSFIAAISLYGLARNKGITKSEKWKVAFFGIAVPIFAFVFLWHRHIALVFADANMARHSMSTSYMLSVFRYKGMGTVHAVVVNYLNKWFTLNPAVNPTREWQTLLGFFALLLVGKIVNARVLNRKNTQEARIALCVAFFYLLYKILMLGMFIFNMPGTDSATIAGYERYLASALIVIYLMGILYTVSFLGGFQRSGQSKRNLLQAAAACVMCLVMVPIYPGDYARAYADLQRPDYQSAGTYRTLNHLKLTNGLPNKGGHILVYAHSWVTIFYESYCFRSKETQWTDSVQAVLAAYGKNPDSYDYLIVLDHDEAIDRVLTERNLPLDQLLFRLRD